MLHKTRGIVFQVTDFRETSVVAKIYTELFGLQGYIINSVRKKNARVKQNALHPLSLVDLVVYHKDTRNNIRISGLHRAADIQANPVLQHLPFDVRKSSIALFLDEVLCKAIKEEETNPLLFEFIFNSIHIIDLQNPMNSDFHLFFLLRLTKYLGFYPTVTSTEGGNIFNLQDGVFQLSTPSHPFYIEPPLTEIFQRLLQSSVQLSVPLGISIDQKRILTQKILEYYQLHLPGFSEIKSRKILEEVWN